MVLHRKTPWPHPTAGLAVLLALLAAVPSPIFCQQPSLTVEVRGVEQLPRDKIVDALRNHYRSDPRYLDTAAIQSSLATIAATEGFFQSRIDSIHTRWKDSATTVTAFVHEGRRAVVRKFLIANNKALSDSVLLDLADVVRDGMFSPAVLESDIERIIKRYEREGYPFASVAVTGIRLNAARDSVDITLDVNEGSLFRVDEITVVGNTNTDRDVIIRESRIRKGEVYNPKKMLNIRRLLTRLRFFETVAEPQLYVKDGRNGILLSVTEGSTNTFDGILGYQPPRSSRETGYFTGLVNVAFRNLFGTGRSLSARWERPSRSSQEIELNYLEPWIFDLPLNIGGGFYQRQQDSTYITQSFHAKVSYLVSDNVSVSALLNSDAVIPSTEWKDNPLLSSSTLSGGLELVIDTRDDVYNPHHGIMFINRYSGGNKYLASDSGDVKSFIQRITLDVGYYQSLFGRFVGAIAFHGRQVRGSHLDVSDFFRLGGANTLRGYREEQFLGSTAAWTSGELRYDLGRRSYIFGFIDYGYILQPADAVLGTSETNLYLPGYGLGIHLETGLGVMGVSYALGKGDSLTDGKIHFGLINEF